jgi:hypothetical protein
VPIEEIDLGLQPKVTVDDDGNYNAEMVPSKEWRATGKEVHDPEFGKLLDQASDYSNEEDARRESIFGQEIMSNPWGGQTAIRGDKVDQMKTQGYGVRERTTRMIVPELPWNKGRQPGSGRTLIKYQDGRRLVFINGELQMEKGND